MSAPQVSLAESKQEVSSGAPQLMSIDWCNFRNAMPNVILAWAFCFVMWLAINCHTDEPMRGAQGMNVRIYIAVFCTFCYLVYTAFTDITPALDRGIERLKTREPRRFLIRNALKAMCAACCFVVVSVILLVTYNEYTCDVTEHATVLPLECESFVNWGALCIVVIAMSILLRGHYLDVMPVLRAGLEIEPGQDEVKAQ